MDLFRHSEASTPGSAAITAQEASPQPLPQRDSILFTSCNRTHIETAEASAAMEHIQLISSDEAQ